MIGLSEIEYLVGSDTLLELLFSVHEVDDTVDDTEDTTDAAANTKKEVDDTTLVVTKVELVNTQTSQKDCKNTCSCLILNNFPFSRG